MRKGALEDLAQISPLDLSGTVQLLRQMNRDDQANDIIAQYVECHGTNKRILDLSQNHFMTDAETDVGLARAFVEKIGSFVDDHDPGAVLLAMADRQRWSQRDVQLLAKLDADGFVAIFERQLGPGLRRVKDSRS